jgi:ribosomal protein L22
MSPDEAEKPKRRRRRGKADAPEVAEVATSSDAARSDEPDASAEDAATRAASADEATPAGAADEAPAAATATAADAAAAEADDAAPADADVPATDTDPEGEESEEPEADAEDEEPEADAEDEEPEADAEDEEPGAEAADDAPKSRRPRRRRAAKETEESKPAAPKPAPARRRRERPAGQPPVVRAQAKYVRSSPRKARLVCDHIRGKTVEEARAILAHTPRAVARDWSKLLESAVANAEHNHELVGEDLYVKAVHADDGPTIKRFQPRAMGRATKIRKRTSHLTILLTPKD